MKIGDKLTQEEFDVLRKKAKSTRFGGDYYILDDDTRFEKRIDSDILYWELVSTLEQRIKDQDTGHPTIHRKESKYFKSYYDKRKI